MSVELPGVDPPEVEAWRWMRQRARFGKAGRRVTMCRFLAAPAACAQNTLQWPIDEFERTYCCLEMDFLTSKKVAPLVLRGDAADGATIGERSGSTSAQRPSVDEAVVRSCSQNAVVISHLMLASKSNERYCAMLRIVALPLVQWHGEQNRELRAADSACRWVVSEFGGGYMKHVSSFIALLVHGRSLHESAMVLTPHEAKALGNDLIAEDEFCDFYGQSIMTLVACRLRRNLGLVMGWPKRLFRLLSGAGAQGRFGLGSASGPGRVLFKTDRPQVCVQLASASLSAQLVS